MQAQFSCYGVRFQIDWGHPLAGEVVHDVISHYGTPATISAAQGDFTLSILVSPFLPPLPVGGAPDKETAHGIKIWRTGERLLLARDTVAVVLDPAHGTGTAHLLADALDRPDAIKWRLADLLAFSVMVLLRHRGLYAVHAAALVKDDAGLLLVAASDSGKSTLSYSLVRQGWEYLTDDTILLARSGARVDALAFRKNFGLDPEAQEYFPELRAGWSTQLYDENKWSIPVDSLFASQFRERCVPRVLVYPEIANQERSELVEIRPAEAMHLLTLQSSLIVLEPTMAQQHMDLLRDLVRQTRHYRFRGGRDVLAGPSLADALLGDLTAACS